MSSTEICCKRVCGSSGRGKRPVENRLAQKTVPILHEEGGPQNRAGQAGLVEVLFDLPFAFEVRQAGLLVGADHRAIHEVPHPGRACRIRQLLALRDFAIVPGLEEVLDGEDSIDAFQRLPERCRLVQIALNQLDSPLLHCLGCPAGRVACQRANPDVRLLQKMTHHRAALLAGRPTDKDRFHLLPGLLICDWLLRTHYSSISSQGKQVGVQRVSGQRPPPK